MILLKDITLRRGSKLLFEHADAAIFAKQKVGVVGLNGCGKSSLFSLLLLQISPDAGDLFIQPNIRIAHLSQEVPHTEISALEYVMQGDQELSSLMQQLKVAEENHDGHLVTMLHNRLYELGGYDLEARAAKVLVGLGFKIKEEQQAVNSFSGGWRMRLNLAQVLMSRADLLLLDEPTNYLDLDAIVWLEEWLHNYPGTLLLISHDRDFLDNVIEKIIYIGNAKLETYTGNYSDFEKQRAEKLSQEQSLYKKQQAQIEHLNKYINRFRYKASKARQAQSRIKMLEKMELVSITHIESSFSFKFLPTVPCSTPLVSMSDVAVSYGDGDVLSKVNFSLGPDDAIGILGLNGAGKSTFMKTLARVLPAKSGNIFFNQGLKTGYFAQHQVDQLDMQASPLTMMQRLDPKVGEKQARAFLGGFGFSKDTVFGEITNFSGGEKARLALALIIWQKPNLLLLDEPTNHLDLEMREALTYALQEYTGALILVAHDRYLLKAVVNEFYIVDDHHVTKFTGDLDDYQKWLIEKRKEPLEVSALPKAEVKNSIKDKKEAKTNSKVNLKHINLLEKEIKKLQVERERIAEMLAGSKIYQPSCRKELEDCLKQSATCEKKLKELEEELLRQHGIEAS